MQKNITKTESMTEFLARGGKVNKVPAKKSGKYYAKKAASRMSIEDMDLSALPAALKIKYGIK